MEMHGICPHIAAIKGLPALIRALMIPMFQQPPPTVCGQVKITCLEYFQYSIYLSKFSIAATAIMLAWNTRKAGTLKTSVSLL